MHGPRPPHKAVVYQSNLGLPPLQGGIKCNLGERALAGDQQTGAAWTRPENNVFVGHGRQLFKTHWSSAQDPLVARTSPAGRTNVRDPQDAQNNQTHRSYLQDKLVAKTRPTGQTRRNHGSHLQDSLVERMHDTYWSYLQDPQVA